MRNFKLRFLLSAMCMASILAGFTTASAAPVRFDQVVQVLNVRPEQRGTGSFMQLRVAGDYSFLVGDDDEGKKKQGQDGRVITTTKSDIVTDDVCDCEEPERERRGFPKWALLGLAAIPIAFILLDDDDDEDPTATPTRTPTRTPSPSPSTTPSPHVTPSITPTPMTPPPSPTPPEPVPEPVTILLFGTGLASIGIAARRRYGKKDNGDGGKEGN